MALNDQILKIVTSSEKDFGTQSAQFLLWSLSVIYGVVVWVLSRIPFGYRSAIKVVSIGNITLGGVGKTPLVVKVAELCRSRGKKPAILTRGYMESGAPSDEVMMLKEQLTDTPVLVGRNRVQNAQQFLKESKADVFILDDGFQHWKFKRDLDIVVIDSAEPWGNGFLLPRGFLRESKTALRRAHVIVLTKTDAADTQKEFIKKELQVINPRLLVAEAVHRPVALKNVFSSHIHALSALSSKDIVGVCAIGDPDSFRLSLQSLPGVRIKDLFTFNDHHAYTAQDLTPIVEYCKSNGVSTLVVTHKDAVKLREFSEVLKGLDVLLLAISLELTSGKDAFEKRIADILGA